MCTYVNAAHRQAEKYGIKFLRGMVNVPSARKRDGIAACLTSAWRNVKNVAFYRVTHARNADFGASA